MKIILISISLFSWTISQTTKNQFQQSIDDRAVQFETIAKSIWDWAEMGYQEEKSSSLLQQTLKEEGFSIQAGVADLPTAFIAEYGSGSPIIGILAEFDALPGISQQVATVRKPIPNKNGGHAC